MKKLLKNILVPVLASRPVTSIADRLSGDGIPIFMAHRFSPTPAPDRHSPEFLRRCLRFLKDKGYSFVSLEDISMSLRGRKALPPRSVAFSMDDGFIDQAELAAPVFIEFNCPVTVFLITGMLDGRLWPWDDQVAHLVNMTRKTLLAPDFMGNMQPLPLSSQMEKSLAIRTIRNFIKSTSGNNIPGIIQSLSELTEVGITCSPPDNYRPMTWDMARKLEKSGIRFAPHTTSHRILSRLSDMESKNEITESRLRLAEELSSPANIFCYPTGRTADYGKREIDFVRDAGYSGAVTTTPTYVDPKNMPDDYIYRLPRFGLPGSFVDFMQYSTWIERAKTRISNRNYQS